MMIAEPTVYRWPQIDLAAVAGSPEEARVAALAMGKPEHREHMASTQPDIRILKVAQDDSDEQS